MEEVDSVLDGLGDDVLGCLDDVSSRDRDLDEEEVVLDGLGDDVLGCLDDVSSRGRDLDEEEVVTVLDGLGDDDLSRDENTDFDDLDDVSSQDLAFDKIDEEPCFFVEEADPAVALIDA